MCVFKREFLPFLLSLIFFLDGKVSVNIMTVLGNGNHSRADTTDPLLELRCTVSSFTSSRLSMLWMIGMLD